LALVAGASLAHAGERDVVLRAGRVLPVASAPIDDGVVVVREGRIVSVGPAAAAVIPPDARVIREDSAWLVPGFIDLHCHVAGTDRAPPNDMVMPVNPDLSVLLNVQPGSEPMLDAVAGGVTTVLYLPGSGTNLSGFAALLHTYGRTTDEEIMRFPGAMKIAQGLNPERRNGEIGRDRMGMAFNLREALSEGRAYHEAWTAWEEGRSTTKPAKVARLELMRGLFRHEFPVLVHTAWMPVYQESVRMLHDEFGLWVILSHTEFDSFHADALVAERDMYVNVGPRMIHADWDTGEVFGLMTRHQDDGIRHLSVNTDSPVVPEEELPFQAALAVRYGLSWDDALRALTMEPALAVGIADRVGSIEPGKDADLVLWSGDPLDPRSHVMVVVGGGRIALDQRGGGERRW
jgi:imidazolonepropionase-like amidohydrolase